MLIKVKEINPDHNVLICKILSSKDEIIVDPFVNGHIPVEEKDNLIGRIFEMRTKYIHGKTYLPEYFEEIG